MASRIASMCSSVERDRSVSSMRRMNTPPWRRAKSQLNSAVRAPPTWRCPVGLGAKRTRTERGIRSFYSDVPGSAAAALGARTRSEAQTADHEAGQRADDQHDEAPRTRRVDHRASGLDRAQNDRRDGV